MTEALLLVESNTTGSGRQFWLKARACGLRPVMLCADPDRYQGLIEDDVNVRRTNTQDDAALLDTARAVSRDLGLAGVTSSSDLFAVRAATLARNLGVPGEHPTAVQRCRDKELQRRILADAGIGGPAYRAVDTVTHAVEAAGSIGLPVVIKPPSRSGSWGVRLCRTFADVAEWAGRLLATTHDERGLPLQPRVLVEEFLDGPEFSVEIVGSEPVVVVHKHLGPRPSFVEIGHDLPARLPDASGNALRAAAVSAISALGLGWGGAHVEVRLTRGGPRIVEVNARLAGGMIPRAVELATGRDLVEEVVRKAAGLAPARPGEGAGAASIRFIVPERSGTIRGWSGEADAAAQPGVAEVVPIRAGGEPITLSGAFGDRVGYLICSGTTTEESAGRAERALAAIRVDVA